MSKNSVQDKLNYVLNKVNKPARYIGGEPYSIEKKDGDFHLRFAFCFPDTYEIGMSSMGLALLYDIMNKTDFVSFERCFAPDADMEALMRNEQLPLYTLESKTPLKECDIVGFTLQYELSYTNILLMLDLAGIPFFSYDRTEEAPLIVAGGPCAFNPEPLADFFDLVMMGDGEEQLPAVCKMYDELKSKGFKKIDILRELANIPGVYIPSLKNHTTRAFLGDLNTVNYPSKQIVPLIEVVHDRAVIELFRGCTRGCRFCQAGMLYRPIRERELEENIRIAKEQLANSGHSEISLLSLSSSDYTQIKPLVKELSCYCKPRQIGISLPSLRLDNFSFDMLRDIQGTKKTGLTFACEAGTQRLRDVINKNVTEKDLLNAVGKAAELGWNSVKLYFMIGLPTETYEDLDGIAILAQKIMDTAREHTYGQKGRFNVNIAVSNFVPKPFTPFQWVRQNTPAEFEEKHAYLRDKISKIRGVQLRYHESFGSTLEAIFARGGRELCKVLVDAYNHGCKFDGWSEHFNEEAWKKALEMNEIDENYKALAGFTLDEQLPWDFINAGIDKEFLLNEYKKSTEAVTTKDCRHGCNGCGINKYTECKLGGIYD